MNKPNLSEAELSVKLSEKPIPKVPEVKKPERPLGAGEQNIIDRIDKDGDSDKVFGDIAEGAVVGAVQRPDGTWDLSRSLISLPDDSSRANEVIAKTKRSIARHDENLRNKQLKEAEDIQPGSAEAVAQRLQKGVDISLRSIDKPETDIDSNPMRQRNLDRLRSERDTLDKVVDKKARELLNQYVSESTKKWGGSIDYWDTPEAYRENYKEAERMPAAEAADRIDTLVQGWEDTLPNIKDPKQAAKLKFDIQCARSLQGKLWDEEGKTMQEKLPEKPTETIQPTPKQETQSIQELLEQRARELADATRKEGCGQLYGFVYPVDKSTFMGFAAGMGFDKGQTIQGDQNQANTLQKTIKSHFPPGEVRNPYDHPNRQIWMMEQYPSNNSMQRITYDMYTVTPYDTRPGVGVMLNAVVPRELADKINASVRENPNFADAYFKAIFPNIVGQNGETHIQRKHATELLLLDQRQNPRNIQGEILKFPQPIEY